MARTTAKRRKSVSNTATKTPAPKRVKKTDETLDMSKQRTADATNQPLGSRNEITLANRQNSPLLRLPTELRDMIWTYAFGNRTLHPRTTRAYTALGVGKVSFNRCTEKFSDAEIYELSRKGAKEDDEYAWKASVLNEPVRRYAPYGVNSIGFHACPHDSDVSFLQDGELVCQQMRREAVPIKWKKTTLCFNDSEDFVDFIKHASKSTSLVDVQSNQTVVPIHLVEEITFTSGGLRNGWTAALKPSNVECFQGLLGIHLLVAMWDWEHSRTGKMGDLEKEWPSSSRHVPNIWKEFQMLQLREDRTTVWIPGGFTSSQHREESMAAPINQGGLIIPPKDALSVPQRLELAERVKVLLLKHKPRRRTGRGR